MRTDDHDDTRGDGWDEDWEEETSTEPLEYQEGSEREEQLEEYTCLYVFHCVCSTWPGMEWSAYVSVYDAGDELVIFQRAGNYCRSDRVPHVEDSWREVARFLAHDDMHWALPDCAANEANFDEDLPRWQDVVLRYCWVRDGPEKDFSLGQILCELPDAWLEGLGRRYDLSDVRWKWSAATRRHALHQARTLAEHHDLPPATMLLRAAAEADPEHGLRDDPNGFRRALGRSLWWNRDYARDLVW